MSSAIRACVKSCVGVPLIDCTRSPGMSFPLIAVPARTVLTEHPSRCDQRNVTPILPGGATIVSVRPIGAVFDRSTGGSEVARFFRNRASGSMPGMAESATAKGS